MCMCLRFCYVHKDGDNHDGDDGGDCDDGDYGHENWHCATLRILILLLTIVAILMPMLI